MKEFEYGITEDDITMLLQRGYVVARGLETEAQSRAYTRGTIEEIVSRAFAEERSRHEAKVIVEEVHEAASGRLLSCPFCGNRPGRYTGAGVYWYACPSCHAETRAAENWGEAERIWNTRRVARPVALNHYEECKMRVEALEAQLTIASESIDALTEENINVNIALAEERVKQAGLEDDNWKKRATEYMENGGCPICFSGDEDGHTDNCEWGQAEKRAESAEAQLVEERARHEEER